MHFVIMGCGRVGPLVATALDADGHSVTVTDMDPKTFSRLPANFSGCRATGFGMDRDTLKQADIKDAYAFAVVSSGDNSDVIAARIVQEVFHVEHTVARIYDPQCAFVYERLGIPTVVTVKCTTESVMRRTLPPDASVIWIHPTGEASLVTATPEESWYGMVFPIVEELTGERITFVSRLGMIIPARPDLVIQEHDQLYFTAAGNNSTHLRDIPTNEPNFQDWHEDRHRRSRLRRPLRRPRTA